MHQLLGWLIAIPVPFLLMWAPSWTWILFANAFLGVSQGLTWSPTVSMKIFLRTTLSDKNLSWGTQAGFVNNLNDGMAWGLFPIVFAAHGMGLQEIGWLAAIYPATWGLNPLGLSSQCSQINLQDLLWAVFCCLKAHDRNCEEKGLIPKTISIKP